MEHAPSIVGEHDEDEEDPECRRGHGEEVDGHEVSEVVVQEQPLSRHVLPHGSPRDLDAQLEKLAVDPRGTPERIRSGHSSDQRPDLWIDLRPSGPSRRLTSPVASESLAMPANNGLRLDEHERPPPVGPTAAKVGPEGAIEVGQRQASVWRDQENR